MFYVGQLVLCVDDHFEPGDGLIRRGSVYRIRQVRPDIAARGRPYGGTPGVVWLEEHANPLAAFNADTRWGYAAARFRPLKDSALDVFTALLEPAPKETEPA